MTVPKQEREEAIAAREAEDAPPEDAPTLLDVEGSAGGIAEAEASSDEASAPLDAADLDAASHAITREQAQGAKDATEIRVEAGSAIADAEEAVEGEIVPDGPGPHPELAEAVDEAVGASAELTVREPGDRHEGLVAMDRHDVDLLLADLTTQAQSAALRRWVYELPDASKAKGLSIHGVQDIVQRMSWTGKSSIRVLPETLSVEKEIAETDDGEQVFYVATVSAEDGKTGMVQIGTSTEPQMMKLKDSTAAAKRKAGKKIRNDNRVFDVFARTKAIGKAQRNAMAAFIPEEVEQAVIAMASKDPRLVERIQTDAEAKVAELPPPLDTPEAKELTGKIEAVYSEIRELGNGQGKVRMTPGQFSAYLLQSQHDLNLLERMLDFVTQRREEIAQEFA